MRATAKEDEDGSIEYSDYWGYEVTMIELLAKKYNFRLIINTVGVPKSTL